MIRLIAAALVLVGWSVVAHSQELSAIATVDADNSRIGDAGDGIEVALDLSQVVPYRVYTVSEPPRLVIDFREVDWRGAGRDRLLRVGRATDMRTGLIRPGWTRLVVDMAVPMVLDRAGLTVNPSSGRARLSVVMRLAEADEFARLSGVPDGVDWDVAEDDPATPTVTALLPDPARPLTVAIDPGHGGIDPGAEREGIKEADLMLRLAQELAEAITRTGTMRAVLTRRDDSFVPLAERMTIARAAGAHLFLSLHADALEDGGAHGGSVYTLSEEGLEAASERMAERHDRGDLLAGLDLTGQDDTVATVLMDLARLETAPASDRLAEALVTGLRGSGARLNTRSRREASLAVLNAADMPSVLIEVGFLSSTRDRTDFESAEGRARIVQGILDGIVAWAEGEASLRPLLRR